MITWLVDLDGAIENLALMRLSAYHKQQGDTVILKRLAKHRHIHIAAALPPLWDRPDRVYISCLFRWNAEKARELQAQWGDVAQLGGTGVDITKALPDDVADCPPDYSLYGQDRAIGFISRGCNNRCPWCVVWRKEGGLHRVSTAAEIVGNRREAIFLDNNFLALPDHATDLAWLSDNGVTIDFNQGLDAAFVTPENARLMAACKWNPGPRLALDHVGRKDKVEQAIAYLEEAGIGHHRITLFVLIGFSGLNSDTERLLLGREWQVNVFPMGYRDLETGEEPARGWDRSLYNKYRKLILRVPKSYRVWDSFRRDVCSPAVGPTALVEIAR